MGAGASTPQPDRALASLPPAVKRGGCFMAYTIPVSLPPVRQTLEHVILEITTDGFRLLRPETEDTLFAIPWQQIYGWTNIDNQFSFKYLDDRTTAMQDCVLQLRDVDELMDSIDEFVAGVLEDRKVKSITAEECASLCTRLANAQPDTKLQLFKDLSGSKFFSCEQGRDIMELMPDPFDKVEVAASLHTRLLDHHAFQHITGALNSAELTANLWHRILHMERLQVNPYRTSSVAMRRSSVQTADLANMLHKNLDLAHAPSRNASSAGRLGT